MSDMTTVLCAFIMLQRHYIALLYVFIYTLYHKKGTAYICL